MSRNINAPLCKFYQNGNCRYGSSCNFRHESNNSAFRGGSANSKPSSSNRKLEISPQTIKEDLTKDRPVWPLSCYAPVGGNNVPRDLLDGDCEISAEEMRCRAYLLQSEGKTAEIANLENAANQNMQRKIDFILGDLNGAINYIHAGFDVHPNRLDKMEAQMKGSTATTSNPSPFGQASSSSPFGSAPKTGGFGQASSLGSASPFARAAQSGGAFGQPSSLGTQSPFAQTNKPATSGFGQPSSLGVGGFGQPSSLGNPSPFGANKPAAGGFGQASALGGKPSPFGTTPPQSGGFGQPSSLGNQSGFGKPSPFGQAPATQPSPFGQTPQNQASPFGQQPSTSQQSPFGQQPATSQALPFGQNPTPAQASPFGQKPTNQSASPFGTTSPFGTQPQTASPFVTATNQPSSFPVAAPTGPRAVASGAASQSTVDDPPAKQYEGQEAAFQTAYEAAAANMDWQGGIMPMVAPKGAWISHQGL